MCFSASASFIAGSVLLVTGVAAVKSADHVRQIAFASIPLLFGIQQLIEGVLWLSMSNSEMHHLVKPCAIAFLIFAQVVWPAWVPFSIYLIEKRSVNKKILGVLMVLGLCVAYYLLHCILTFPVNAVISAHHINYQLEFPYQNYKVMGVFYFMATVLPPFASGAGKRMKLLGLVILISFIISKIFFAEYVISVWCYFAAALSVIVFFIIRGLKEKMVTP